MDYLPDSARWPVGALLGRYHGLPLVYHYDASSCGHGKRSEGASIRLRCSSLWLPRGSSSRLATPLILALTRRFPLAKTEDWTTCRYLAGALAIGIAHVAWSAVPEWMINLLGNVLRLHFAPCSSSPFTCSSTRA